MASNDPLHETPRTTNITSWVWNAYYHHTSETLRYRDFELLPMPQGYNAFIPKEFKPPPPIPLLAVIAHEFKFRQKHNFFDNQCRDIRQL